MQKARMGMLDLEAFKRQVRYATLPDGTVTDAVLQTGGRYDDLTDFMYMAPMGIWFENFALPAVINECLMQSHDGIIELFPNWPLNVDASFSTLRARGAFLISATLADGAITHIEIHSEKGNPVTLVWPPASITSPSASTASLSASTALPTATHTSPTTATNSRFHSTVSLSSASPTDPVAITDTEGNTFTVTPTDGLLQFPTTRGETYTLTPVR